jgi:hypothetical protein
LSWWEGHATGDDCRVPTLTLLHVVISLVGILAGLVVARQFPANRHSAGWVALFLWSTVATSVTGFIFFPLQPFTPAHAFGVISLVVLALALYALYSRRLARGWRRVYVISSLVALYLNVFVAVVQAFQKIPFLKTLAPTQSEPPFAIAQLAVLILFIVLGIAGVKRFHTAVPHSIGSAPGPQDANAAIHDP